MVVRIGPPEDDVGPLLHLFLEAPFLDHPEAPGVEAVTTVSATSESGVKATGVPADSCMSIHICILLVVSIGASGANSAGRSAAAQIPVSRIPSVFPEGNRTDTPMGAPISWS